MKYLLLAVLLVFLVPLMRRMGKRTESDGEAKPLPPKRARDDDDDDEDPARAKAAADARFQELLRTVIVLEDNEWSACTIDGVREEWARFTAKDVAGFAAVPGGRHRVVTRVGEGDGRDATLDFVLFPGEVFARRLDRDACAWRELDDSALASVNVRAKDGEKGALGESLVSYRSTMGIARTQSKSTRTVSSPDAMVKRACEGLAALDADDDASVAKAKSLGEELIGVPLTRAQIESIAGATKHARLADAAMPGARGRVPSS